jgi:hypothetical protein
MRSLLSDPELPANNPLLVFYTGQDASSVPRYMTHLVVASSVATIQAFAFCQCHRLVSVEFQEGIQVIGEQSFSFCTSLKRVRFPSSLRVIGRLAFTRCARLEMVELNEGLEVLRDGSFSFCTALKTLRIPPTIRGIAREMVCGCTQLESIELPNRLRIIDERAFSECSSLRNIAMPQTVDTIADDLFLECTSLQQLVIEGDDHDYSQRDANTAMRLMNALQCRFNRLPIHRLCYYHSYYKVAVTMEALRLATADDRTDMFGMTTFHILAFSVKPNFHIFSALLELYPVDVLYQKDVWGNPPIYYLCKNSDPEAVSILNHLVQLTMLGRLKLLSPELWRRNISFEVEAFYLKDSSERANQIGRIYSALSKYERLEITSLVELALWSAKLADAKLETQRMTNGPTSPGDLEGQRRCKKAKTDESSFFKKQADAINRQACRVNCGADTVIGNVIPFLGPLYVTITANNDD